MPRAFVKPLALLLALAWGPAAAQDCVMDAWERILAPGFQDHVVRERFDTPMGHVVVLEFSPLKGEYAKRYLFLLDGPDCFLGAVVVGSYEATTQYARESGAVPPDGRIWHVDLYTGDSHETLSMAPEPPPYEEAKRIALEALRR